MVLTHLDILHNVIGERRPTLVLGPKRVAQNVWTDEAAKWQHLEGLRVISAVGDQHARHVAMTQGIKAGAQVVALNYDNLPWLVEHYGGKNWPFATVVADESTKLKGFRSKQGTLRSAALGTVTHTRVERWISLTGTPAPNGLRDLWGQLWFIDGGARLGRTFSAFEDRWFGYKRVKDAATHKLGVKPIIQPNADREIHERIADVCLSLDPKDWFDLEEPVVNVIEVDLPPSVRKTYREMEREMFTRLESGEGVEAVNAAALTMKCLQIASGTVLLDPERYGPGQAIEVHWEKLDALEELAEETGEPILVAYHFRADLARLMKRFPDGADLATEEGMARFKAGQAQLGFGHPASMGHGVDGLQEHCCTIAIFGPWWDLEQYDQFIERVGPMRQFQSGKKRPVFIHHIVARKTIDELVLARRDSKRSVQDALMAYMKESK